MRSLLKCPRMKYKSRIVVSVVTVMVLMSGAIFLDIASNKVSYKRAGMHSVKNDSHVIEDHIEIRQNDVDKKDKTITKDMNVVTEAAKMSDTLQRLVIIEKSDINVTKARSYADNIHVTDTPKIKETLMFNENIERLLNQLESITNFGFNREFMHKTPFRDIALQLGRTNRVKSKHVLTWDTRELRDDRTTNFVRFHHGIRAAAMYDPEDPAVDGLLHDMAKETLRDVEMIERGTELKLLMRFAKGTRAVFKPMRWGREVETLPNHFYFNDFERHNAEIAAFHLDRIMGFYRVPPVTGRKLNMTTEIYDLGGRALQKTFYVSPVGNICFYGVCDYYCDSNHAFCGKGDIIEGSLMVWLPEGWEAKRDSWKSPYRRSYSKLKKAEWETDDAYCQKLMKKSHYKRFIPDLIDSHIFDFITGNMDRHHMEVFARHRNDSCPIHLDNGRGFGKAYVDEDSIITPLRQCCRIRKSTFLKLAKLYIGPERLSELLDASTKSDPVYPVLLEDHLKAVDRRVIYILNIVAECTVKYGLNKVIIADGF